MVFSILGGVLYGWLTNTHDVSRALASKIITGISFTLAVGVYPCMGLARSSAAGTLLSSLALASVALSRGGWSTNHVEIASPEHAAMLYSVANCISAATSVVGISLTGKVLDAFGGGEHSLAWTVAMGSIGAVCGACGIYYVYFAEGDSSLFPASGRADIDEAETGGAEQETRKRRAIDALADWPRPFGWGEEVPHEGPGP